MGTKGVPKQAPCWSLEGALSPNRASAMCCVVNAKRSPQRSGSPTRGGGRACALLLEPKAKSSLGKGLARWAPPPPGKATRSALENGGACSLQQAPWDDCPADPKSLLLFPFSEGNGVV